MNDAGARHSRPVAVAGIRAPAPVVFPRMIRVVQRFPTPGRCDVEAEVARQVGALETAGRIPRGRRVAIAVGSRGIGALDRITAAVVSSLRRGGAEPVIVPAMGSHGGATAEGQREVLASLGITEARVGAPVVSSMDVVELGRLADGSGVYWDREAYEAGAAVVVCRVKPHTAFRGRVESGLIKMATIGLGKQRGAQSLHAPGFAGFGDRLLEAWEIVRRRAPLLFGVAVVEDAYDQPVEIAVLPPEAWRDREPALLDRARRLMARLPVRAADVLVVQEIGKNVSGDGMDPNITGRYPTPYASGGPQIRKIVVLGLTPETHGNANGIGLADFITQRALGTIDLHATYMNALTSTVAETVRLPMVLATDRDAIAAAILTAPGPGPGQVRLVYIRNTLALGEVAVSTSLGSALEPHARPASEPAPLSFAADGTLLPPLAAAAAAGPARGDFR